MGEVAQIPLGLHLFLIEAQCVLRDNFNVKVCISSISVCTPISSSFLYHTYCCVSCTKSTLWRENVTKDNNSIAYNDELFHTMSRRKDLSFGE